MPRVSVLLPNYNNAPYLKEALDSIFNQTFRDFDIYFVDDCSTDNSIEIAESYADDRLKVIRKEKNSGIVDTMNVGLDRIESEFFIRMDGDDISTPDRFQKLVSYMDENPEIGVCSSDIKTFGKVEEFLTYERDGQLNRANLLFGHTIGHASSIFRTAVLKENNVRYVDRFWGMEDYYLFYQLKDVTLTSSIPAELYLYRREDYNLNEEIVEKKKREFRSFYKMIFEDLGLNFSDKELALHLQLSKREVPEFGLKIYQTHADKILAANQNAKIFPQEELKAVLRKYLRILIFRLIDFTLIPHFFKESGLFKHYLKKKFNLLTK